ncbi:unnamed protein product [Phytomonas sp. Hart1]|nr:unnamed protein product [Phytomonas sp. Hart1]|eukprot:CCW68423.1 unnamed protein product [Phytomonas sp. isolate Hart1]
MEVSREGHSGLYTMHFSNIFPDVVPKTDQKSPKCTTASASPEAPAHPVCSIVEFSQWHVLIRMNVGNDVCFVKGEAKIFSPTPSLTSTAARGMKRTGEVVANQTIPDGVPIVPVHQKDRKCHVFIEGTYRPQLDMVQDGDGISTFRLEVHMETVEGELLGLTEPNELKDVVFSCSGFRACGWTSGSVSVSVAGKLLKMTHTLRFLLKPYYGKRCTLCLDPVYAIGYTCDECEMTQYCSRDCLNNHMRKGHGLLCPILKKNYRIKSGCVTTEVNDDTGLVAWWRCLEEGYFTILVDSGNALGCAIELYLCTLKSAKEEGLRYKLITPAPKEDDDGVKITTSPQTPTEEDVIDFSCVLLREVNRSAILSGCVSLTATCLNYLYVFSPSTEITIQAHVLFSAAFYCNRLEGAITTVEEYISYARSLHALSALLMEYALKSPIASEFWRRIREARATLVALCRIHRANPCLGVPGMREIVESQQCDTLISLAKVFVVMATRTPEGDSRGWLYESEKCMRQCIGNESLKRNQRAYALVLFGFSALLLLYKDDAKNEEARLMRLEAEGLLRRWRAQRPKTGSEL